MDAYTAILLLLILYSFYIQLSLNLNWYFWQTIKLNLYPPHHEFEKEVLPYKNLHRRLFHVSKITSYSTNISTIEQWYINSNQTVTDCGFPTPLWYYAEEKYQYSILLVIKVKYILIRCKFLQASQQTNSCHIFCILDI